MNEKCFCHIGMAVGTRYKVKDADAREQIETLNDSLDALNGSLDNLYVNSINDLKTMTSLSNGNVVKTLGYYSANDGGSALYKIRAKSSSDVEGDGTIHFLQNNLVAELILEDRISIKQLGAKANDESFDNSPIVRNAIVLSSTKGIEAYIPKGTFICLTPISFTSELKNVNLVGYSEGMATNENYSQLEYKGSGDFITFNGLMLSKIEKINFKGNQTNILIYSKGSATNKCYKNIFRNLTLEGCIYGIKVENSIYTHYSHIIGYASDYTKALIYILANNNLNEYNYIVDSSFEGASTLAENGIIIENANFTWFNNLDICNFHSGSGIKVFKQCNNVFINNVSTMRCLRHYNIDDDLTTSIQNVNFNDIIASVAGTSGFENEVVFYFRGDSYHQVTKVSGRGLVIKSIGWQIQPNYLIDLSADSDYMALTYSGFEFVGYNSWGETKIKAGNDSNRIRFVDTKNCMRNQNYSGQTNVIEFVIPQIVNIDGNLLYPYPFINAIGYGGKITNVEYSNNRYKYTYKLDEAPSGSYKINAMLL